MINITNDNLLINEEVNKKFKNNKREVYSNGYIFYSPDGIGKTNGFKFIKNF